MASLPTDDELGQLSRLIDTSGLTQYSESIMRSARVGVRVLTEKHGRIRRGLSRLGGLPDLPAGCPWPYWGKSPLTFLGQFNVAELFDLDPQCGLPSEGMLFFYYSSEEEPWGFDPEDAGGSSVIYSSKVTSSRPNKCNKGTKVLPNVPIRLSRQLSIPSRIWDAVPGWTGPDEYIAKYLDVYWGLNLDPKVPNHQLFGYPYLIQQPMELECQLVTNGVYCGDGSVSKHPRYAELEPGARDWRLLLQMDSDERLGVSWAGDGILYYWARYQDIRARKFGQTWTILQV